jgi:hydrogenase-4 component F
MILLLLLIPTAAAVLSLIVPWVALRRTILVLAATAHTAVTLAAWIVLPDPLLDGWLMLDPFGLLFLTITSILFLACAWYTAGYLARETRTKKQDFEENLFFTNAPEAVFCGCLSAFLATMTLVTVSRHLGLLWVAMEATTLVTAPLIYFHRHRRFRSGLACLSCLEHSDGAGSESEPALAEGRFPVFAGRIRNQDGSSSSAYLAAGCPQ